MTAYKPGDPTTLNRLYGRSSSHRLRPAQQALMDTLLPTIIMPTDGEINSATLFGDDRPLHLEIGFGSGEHLAHRADLLPDHGFIGCEPFVNGVATALGHVRDRGLVNVRIHMGDALEVLRRLPDAALSFVYLLHPDPWPKARHAKRRMVNGGPLLEWTLMVMQRLSGDFEWLVQGPRDFLEPPGGWIETRYGAKSRREGRRPYYFR
jgi:tRNA (guanine-N7-)-methyltransferase